MRPYRVVKDSEDRMRHESWSPEVSTFAFQKIRREERIKLNEGDCERATAAGVGHLIVKGKYGRELATCLVGETTGNYEIDPVASRIKHSGLDFKKAVGKRWRAFCAQPQDEELVRSAMLMAVEEEADEEETEPTLEVRLTPTHELIAPLKRRPGRPRKVMAGGV